MWPIPVSLLVVSLGLVILVGGLIAHLKRRRRIAQFGDAAVLGLARRHYSSTIPPLLTSAAAGFVAAALVLQPGTQRSSNEDSASLEIVIDTRSMKSGTGADAAAAICDAVRTVLAESPSCRIAVFLSGDPPQLLIPPTLDMQGSLIVMNELTVRETLRGRRSEAEASHVVYVTSQAPEDIENAHGRFYGSLNTAFVVLTAGSGDLLFGTRDPDGELGWSASPLELHEFLASKRVAETGFGTWLQNFSTVQWMALAGFAFLSAEFLWNYFRP